MCILSKQWRIQVTHHTTEVITLFAGTRVQLLSPRQRDQSDKGFVNWKFMSVLTWGEQPRGTWVLDIIDEVTGDNRAAFSLYGNVFKILLDFRLPPCYKSDLRSFEMLRGVD
jgi:subtilisin-like proprotein convertase family protein